MLDDKMAQGIADKVMNGLGYNINVMNKQAIIIGSGNVDRIGTYHEGAMRAITERQSYEVTEEDALRLQGVKPGINMPIVGKKGDVLGVIGITGNPEEVRNIGALVKMTAELIIEQEESMDRFYRHRNDKEMFVAALLNETADKNIEEMMLWGERMGYNMDMNRVACIFSYHKEEKINEKDSERLLDQIKDSAAHSKQDISVLVKGGFILVFKTLMDTAPWEIEKTVLAYFKQIHEYLKDSRPLNVWVGGYYKGISGYRQSYNDAFYLCNQYKKTEAESIHFTHKHFVDRMYDQLSPEVISNILEPYISRIEKHFSKGT
ncbi:MAG: sugar diacid recognition domain-containing protein, partial [Eubacterium sp.]